MRALFAFAGGKGHAEPLVPIAAALRDAGHAVAFFGRSDVVASLRARGFAAFAEPRDTTSAPRAAIGLQPFDAEREARALRDGYAGRIARARAESVLDACAGFSPDLLVCDELDFGAMVAAERLALPRATVLVTAAGSFVRPQQLAAPLGALRAAHGLAPDPSLAMLHGDLVLAPLPPSFRDPAAPLPPGAHALRPAGAPPTGISRPTPDAGGGRPLVYVTLGTVFNMESGDLLERLVAALRELPVELVATVGSERDPAALGPQPPHVRVTRYVDHAALLPRCALVVSHGGSGTLVAALAAGVPSLVLPLGADQGLNAARCAALDVGSALDASAASADDVRAAARRLLADPAVRRAAGRMRDEIAALPGPAHAVELLEALIMRREPDRGGAALGLDGRDRDAAIDA